MCTWHPEEVETSSPPLSTDGSDVTVAAPTLQPDALTEDGGGRTASALVPGVPAATQGGVAGICTQQSTADDDGERRACLFTLLHEKSFNVSALHC